MDEAEIQLMRDRYLDNVAAYCDHSTVMNPHTGMRHPPDENFMREVEEFLYVPEQAADDYRRSIMAAIGALAVRGKNLEEINKHNFNRGVLSVCCRWTNWQIDPQWKTTTVMSLARGIVEEQALDRMPILADALQDADCDNDDLLAHIRNAGNHVCCVAAVIVGTQKEESGG